MSLSVVVILFSPGEFDRFRHLKPCYSAQLVTKRCQFYALDTLESPCQRERSQRPITLPPLRQRRDSSLLSQPCSGRLCSEMQSRGTVPEGEEGYSNGPSILWRPCFSFRYELLGFLVELQITYRGQILNRVCLLFLYDLYCAGICDVFLWHQLVQENMYHVYIYITSSVETGATGVDPPARLRACSISCPLTALKKLRIK